MAIGAGSANLAEAFFGGGGIENAAYGRAAQQLSSAGANRALMDERVQKAFMLAQQNKAQQNLMDNPVDLLSGAYTPEQQMAILAAQGHSNPNLVAQAFSEGAEFKRRGDLEGVLTEDPNVSKANALIQAIKPSPTLMPTVENVDNLIVRGNYGENPVVDQLKTAMNADATASASSKATGDQRDRKIQNLMAQTNPSTGVNFTHSEAANIVDKHVRSEITDAGEVLRIDDVSGVPTFTPIQGGTTGEPVPTPAPGEALYDKAGVATGPGSTIMSMIAPIASMAGVDAGEPFVAARQAFKTSQGEMIRALAQNPRLPVKEMEWLRKEIDIQPKFYDTPELLQTRMVSLDASLRRRLARYERDQSDHNLSPDTRAGIKEAARDIRNFLAEMGVPSQTSAEIPPQVRESLTRELEALPGWSEATPERREYLIQLEAKARSQ